MITRSKIAGALYGVALGDALGRDTEFMRLKEIRKAYGRDAYMPLPEPALFTDDTQLTIAVARAIGDARSLKRQELVRTLADRFIEWRRVDEPRAPGVSCVKSISRLKITRKWKRSWVEAPVMSRGCGANMRVVPAALVNNIDTALGISQLQAAMTHAHPLALVATELTALAVRRAAEGMELTRLPYMLLEWSRQGGGGYRREWLSNLDSRRWRTVGELRMTEAHHFATHRTQDVINLLRYDRQPHDVCAVLGDAWNADEALACGLYFAVHYANDPVRAISMAARTSGDSDSIASITGAIIGASQGAHIWPREWRDRIERQDDIENAIDIVHDTYPVFIAR